MDLWIPWPRHRPDFSPQLALGLIPRALQEKGLTALACTPNRRGAMLLVRNGEGIHRLMREGIPMSVGPPLTVMLPGEYATIGVPQTLILGPALVQGRLSSNSMEVCHRLAQKLGSVVSFRRERPRLGDIPTLRWEASFRGSQKWLSSRKFGKTGT